MRGSAWLWIVVLVVFTLWIDFSAFHAATTADTLIPVFASTVEWTPFYWSQDRYGMLVALLCAPVKHPLWNLLAQSALTIFAGLAAFPLLARYFFRGSASLAIGFASIAWMMAFSDREYPSAWLSITMFYAPALTLGIAALLLLELPGTPRVRVAYGALALLSMALAHWINFSIVVMLGLLFAARTIGDPARTTPARGSWLAHRLRAFVSPGLATLAFGALVGRLVMSTAPPSWRAAQYKVLPPSEWWHGWSNALHNRDFGVGPWALFAVVPAVAVLASRRVRRDPNVEARAAITRSAPALLGLAAAIVYALFVQATDLAKLGNFPARYLVMSTAVTIVLSLGLALEGDTTPPRWALPASAGVAAITLLLRWGVPSTSNVVSSLDPRFSAHTADLVDARCTHMIGNYWDVWPSVFDVMRASRDRGAPAMLWGITLRSDVTAARWRSMPRSSITLCAGKEHPDDVAWFMAFEKLGTPRIIGERPSIVVLEWPE